MNTILQLAIILITLLWMITFSLVNEDIHGTTQPKQSNDNQKVTKPNLAKVKEAPQNKTTNDSQKVTKLGLLTIKPQVIDLKIPSNKIKDVSQYGLRITSNKNFGNIRAQFSDLIPQGDNKIPISRNMLSIKPTVFNVTAGQFTYVDVVLTLPNRTGTYEGDMNEAYDGEMLLVYEGGMTGPIPVKLDAGPTLLKTKPISIDLKIPSNKIKDVSQYGLRITSNKNVGNIRAQFSDLIPQGDNKIPISRNMLSIKPTVFNVTAGQFTYVDVVLTLPNRTGTYEGDMILAYHGGVSDNIPFKVTISDDIPIYGLLVVLLGALSAFIVKLMRSNMDARDVAIASAKKTIAEMYKASRDKRYVNGFMEGLDAIVTTIPKYLSLGYYNEAKEKFEEITQLFKDAKKDDDVNSKHNPLVPREEDVLLGAFSVSARGLYKSLSQPVMLVYLITAILLLVGVMQVWIQVMPKLVSLSDTFLGYFSAFLLGYGSQSVLGEVIEFARRR